MPFFSASPLIASALKNDAVGGALARSTGMARGLFLQFHPAKSKDLLRWGQRSVKRNAKNDASISI